MLVTKEPVLKRFWYATVKSQNLNSGPIPFTLLGENIVIWKNNHGQPAAVRDRCCHRTAKLSQGFVDDEGNISCGYHGWSYNCEGKCTKIPQIKNSQKVSDNIFVEAYKAIDKYGYVWVCLGEPIADIPVFKEDADVSFRRIFQCDEKWETSSLRFMENSFDNSHVSFVHKSSFGIFNEPKPSSYDLTELPRGFIGETKFSVSNPEEAYRVTGVKRDKVERTVSSQWWIPFIRKLGLVYQESGVHHIIYDCATPISDGSMQLIQWLYRNDSEAQCSTNELIGWDRQVLNEDRRILESTDPDVCLDISSCVEKHMASDRPGLVMRKLLNKMLNDNSVVKA